MRGARISSFRNGEGMIVVTVDPRSPESTLTDGEFDRLGDAIAEYLTRIGFQDLVGAASARPHLVSQPPDDEVDELPAVGANEEALEEPGFRMAAGWW